MPIPRLIPEQTALLVIDLQERLMPTIVDAQQVTNNAAIMLRVADLLEIPYLVTEQYPTGLGRTIEHVAAAMPDRSLRVEKTRFSAAVDVVLDRLERWRRPTVLICGIEAHVCVLQTVLDLQGVGRQCFVCLDAISACQREQIRPACARMERAGAIISGCMSSIYELLQDSAHPAFRPCLAQVRELEW